MDVQRQHHDSACLLVVSGAVTAADADELRGQCYAALSEAVERAGAPGATDRDPFDTGGPDRPQPVDLLIDARRATRFDDLATRALSSARTRVRHLGGHVVVVDDAAGALQTSLRRTGLAFRFPRFDSPAAAGASLARDREVRSLRDTPLEARWRRAR
ncbi:STAS domain-containing protein [Quadrisphaera setariae]|uniref:STAS domain-containing protein n=1 Tax=Quadrisphaera setariae TaxID=2593304 RepID=A0A5C8ZE75_9ACTN|nr:STAS domain-containing protein [Quadrisphaera setariae]TXR56107.1 hypothetical protein FMM08_11790 [Quadrisphaera setariae]